MDNNDYRNKYKYLRYVGFAVVLVVLLIASRKGYISQSDYIDKIAEAEENSIEATASDIQDEADTDIQDETEATLQEDASEAVESQDNTGTEDITEITDITENVALVDALETADSAQATEIPDSEYDSSDSEQVTEGEEQYTTVESEAESPLYFRNEKLLNDHYEKHGIEMGFASAKEYEKAASAVVFNPDSLHKLEKDDGDDIYYLEASNEYVVVSKDGYIRTYYYPRDGIAYYNRK